MIRETAVELWQWIWSDAEFEDLQSASRDKRSAGALVMDADYRGLAVVRSLGAMESQCGCSSMGINCSLQSPL